tara:strand:+ start:273 stop:1268 length:996 start_codon:yes stop_codon:yes gene_type:complete
MGYNLLSGSITLSQTGSIQVTGSFQGALSGRVTENSDVPHTTVYSISNAGTDRLITTNDGSGESFNGEESLTFSSADQTLTIVGHDSSDTTAVLISGSTSNDNLLRVKSNATDNILLVDGAGKVGIKTAAPIAELDVAGTIAITSERNSTPSQPSDGQGYLYTKNDGKLYWRSHDVTEVDLTVGSGGGGSGDGIFTEIDADEAYVTSSLTIGADSNPTHTLTLIGNSHLSGGVCHKRYHTAEDYTITTSDYYIGVDTSSSAVKLTLPAAASVTSGQTFVIKDEGGAASTNNVTVHISAAGNTIDGGESILLESPYAAVSIYSNGATAFFVY